MASFVHFEHSCKIKQTLSWSRLHRCNVERTIPVLKNFENNYWTIKVRLTDFFHRRGEYVKKNGTTDSHFTTLSGVSSAIHCGCGYKRLTLTHSQCKRQIIRVTDPPGETTVSQNSD